MYFFPDIKIFWRRRCPEWVIVSRHLSFYLLLLCFCKYKDQIDHCPAVKPTGAWRLCSLFLIAGYGMMCYTWNDKSAIIQEDIMSSDIAKIFGMK